MSEEASGNGSAAAAAEETIIVAQSFLGCPSNLFIINWGYYGRFVGILRINCEYMYNGYELRVFVN